MRIHFIKTGNGGMEPKCLKFQLARHAKTVFIVLYFFGITVSWGAFDIVEQYRIATSQQPQVPMPQNRAQRRRMMHVIKKVRHAKHA